MEAAAKTVSSTESAELLSAALLSVLWEAPPPQPASIASDRAAAANLAKQFFFIRLSPLLYAFLMKDIGKVKQCFQHTAADRKRLIGCGIAVFTLAARINVTGFHALMYGYASL